MKTSDKALAWWAALTPDKILLLYIDNELGGIEENNTVEQLFDKAYALGREHEKKESEKVVANCLASSVLKVKDKYLLAKKNYEIAEYLWQELAGVVMLNEQGVILNSEQIKGCRDALESHRPIKQ